MIQLGVLLLQHAVDRARSLRARDDLDRGASALEWAIIAAVVVVAASVIGGVIFNIVQNKSAALDACANAPVGAACAP